MSDLDSKVGECAPDQWRQLVGEVLASGLKRNLEIKHRDKIYLFEIVPLIDDSYVNLYGLDITERKQVEKALKKSEEEIRKDKLALEQKNLALKELIEHMDRTKNKAKEDIAINIEEFIMPILKKLRLKGVSPKYVDLISYHLDEISSSFGRKITQRSARLSPER